MIKVLKNLLAVVLVFFIFSPFVIKHAYADSFTLSGNVKDSSNNVLVGATIDIYAQGTTNDVVTPTTTDQSGNYSFASVPQGIYDIKVTPPSGSNYSSAIVTNETISSNLTINFLLTPAGIVTFNGTISGPNGNALANQNVSLHSLGGGTPQATTTDANGQFAFPPVSEGQYYLVVTSPDNLNDPSLNISPQYNVSSGALSS